jgi:predicted nucleic acid-binding protein
MSRPVVSNASPLIALKQIGQMELLSHLFNHVLVAPAVVREVEPTLPRLPEWIEVSALKQPLGARILAASLGPGESETIRLALEVTASHVLVDDRPARRLATLLGLRVGGTLGVLVASKQRGLVRTVKPLLDALLEHNFRISDSLQMLVLRSVDELE